VPVHNFIGHVEITSDEEVSGVGVVDAPEELLSKIG
jgi:hypothetical protein